MAIRDFFQAQGKAIPAHPALMDHNTPIEVLDMNDRDSRQKRRLTQREASRHLQAYGGKNDAIDWVMDCVRLYCDAAAEAPWYLQSEEEDRLYKNLGSKTPPGAKLGPKALYSLLEAPNPYMDYEEMIALLIIDLLLVGNAYWFKWRTNDEGQPLAMYRLAPPFVKVIPGDMGVVGYEYKVPDSGQKNPLEIHPDEIIHFKLPNPHDPYYGLGVIQGGGRPLDLELALTEHQARYYEKGTNPSMIVQSDRRVPKDVKSKLFQQMRARYAGPRNAGELMVLEAGLKAQSLTPNAAEAAFKEISGMSRDRIFAMFRVHPKLLGIVASDGSDKADDAQRVFDNNTLKPFFGTISRRVSRNLTRAYDSVDFIIDHRYRLPKQDQIKMAGELAGIPGMMIKEIREFLDYPPTGDPEIDDFVLNMPGEEGEEDNTRNGFPDRSLPGEAGRPPRGENTRGFGTPQSSAARRPSEKAPKGRVAKPSGKAVPVEQTLERLQQIIDLAPKEEGKAVTLNEPSNTSVGPGTKLPDEERPTDRLAPRRDDEVDAIARDLRADLREAGVALERELLDHVEGKAFNGNNLRSRMRQSEAWQRFRDKVADAMERAAKRGLSRAVVMHDDMRPEDEIDYDALAKELVWRKDGVRAIVNNMRDRVANHLKGALESGGGKDESEAAVREAIQVWQDTQSETVALTEAVHAFNEGTLTVAELTGHTHVFVTDGHDHDAPCQDADGQVWEINHARDNRLEHPRCRRAFVAMPVAS